MGCSWGLPEWIPFESICQPTKFGIYQIHLQVPHCFKISLNFGVTKGLVKISKSKKGLRRAVLKRQLRLKIGNFVQLEVGSSI